jgi:hypothetical protein
VALPGDGPVDLAMDVDGADLQFSWRIPGGDWQRIGPVLDASVISDEGGRGEHASFTGAFTGMAAFDTSGSAIRRGFRPVCLYAGRGMMRSTLCIYEIATGMVEDVLSQPRLIEAPNWMPDGTALLVNGDGRMFRVPLDAPDLVPIDTGHAVECNNDHGVSPDGVGWSSAIPPIPANPASGCFRLPAAHRGA